jgi:hypothetical protein
MNDLDILASPLPADHIAHAYVDPTHLMEGLLDFVGNGLGRDEVVLALVPAPLRTRLGARLADAGFALGFLEKSGQLRFDDATTVVDTYVDGDAVEVGGLQAYLTALLEVARAGGRYQRVRVVAAMADMLWRKQLPAAVTLERAWNDLMNAERVSLLCPYTLDASGGVYGALPHAIHRVHSHTLRA